MPRRPEPAELVAARDLLRANHEAQQDAVETQQQSGPPTIDLPRRPATTDACSGGQATGT